MGSIAAGLNTHADGIASTVVGSYSGVINADGTSGLNGATALSYGTFNVNLNNDSSKRVSGVANSIIGQANVTENSNAAIIYGAGNTVTNSYRDIVTPKESGVDKDKVKADVANKDITAVIKDAQVAVPSSGGQVMVMGGGNNVDKAYMTQVTGVGNTVTGSGEKYDKDSSTQLNYVDGFYTTLENGKNDYIIGSHNTVTGTSTATNQSNIVFGDNHTLTDKSHNIIIGSATKEGTAINASNAVIIGQDANASVDGSVAIGSGSVASTAASVAGYDPTTGTDPTSSKNAWTATNAAVSIGTADGTVTRQINGVAAGTKETDAVNVAQLKKLEGMKANVDASNIGSNIKVYQKDENGKVLVDEKNQPILDTDATKTAQETNANKWGTAIGNGSIADPTQSATNDPEKNGSQQLVTGGTVYKALHGGLDDIVIGHDGKDGSIGLVGPTGPKGEDGKNAYATTIIKTEKGADGIDGKNGKDGITRIVYNDTNDPEKKHTVATLDDGMKYAGDTGDAAKVKLDHQLTLSGTTFNKTDKQYKEEDWTSDNIAVVSKAAGEDGNATMYLKLNKDLNLTDKGSVRFGDKDSSTTLDASGLTIKSTVTEDGNTKTVNGPSVTKNGINGGGKQITNIGDGITTDGNGKYTVTDENKGNAANISDVQNIVNDAKKDLTNGANGLNSKANVNASNIGENMKDAKGNKASAAEITKNKEAWASAIGTDTVAKGNKQLVTSDAVATALDSKADKTYVDKQLDTKANKSDVYTKDQTYSKSEVDSKVSDITTGLDGKAGKDLDNISDKGQQVIHNIAKDAVEVVDGTNTTVTKTDGTNTKPTKYAVNVEGKGKVASGDTGLISGDTLYKEVHIDKDGAYIKGSQSVGQNLSNLDTGLKTTSDLIHTNAKGDTIQIGGNSTATKIDISGKDKDGKSTGRVITGIVSDANDPNSAANVGYVNGITSASNEQIYHDMNMQYNHVENDISRAAAGSNALAALHPMQEFDPDDKAQFALGYGHYRNSNAGAVGAFYQPDENSMVNFGVSFGNGDAGINAGVTFKFGPGGSGHHALTKTQMAKVIDAQSKEIDELKKDNADKDKRIDALEQKMTEILAKLDKSKD